MTIPRATAGDFEKLSEQYEARAPAEAIEKFARSLGVSSESLRRLHVGFDGAAWTFPMRDANGHVVGIRRRLPDGRKLSVLGGHEGIFVPDGIATDSPVIIAEGPTDTAAILTLQLPAIGRPSCSGSVHTLSEYCRGRRVAVLADADEPGRVGAWVLAEMLKLYCESVRVVRPPLAIKDGRAWVQAGGTREDVVRAIREVQPTQCEVRFNGR